MKKVLAWFMILLTILLVVFAIGSVFYASIMQVALCWQRLGFYVVCLIPDKSAWWFMGGLALIPAIITFRVWCELTE